MNNRVWIAVAVAVVALLVGVGYKTRQANIKLPDWAPKNASPEFCIAAQVLESSSSAPEQGVDDARFHSILVPAWEFFGTLSNEQIDRFKTSKSISLPCTSLTPKQRRALNNYFNVYRQVMKNQSGEWPSDELAELCRLGAQPDLSNVDLLIDIRETGLVRFACTIRKNDGSVTNPLPLTGLGTIQPASK